MSNLISPSFLHVIYAYYEGKPNYRMNLLYFLKNGYLPHITYTFVINGQCTVEFPNRNNITVIRRENTGFDFQGYYTGLLSLKKTNQLRPSHYYMFLNCTVRGPFLPSYVNRHLYWYTPFLDLLEDPVKLVGSTINVVDSPYPHVQTYTFMMGYETVSFLLEIQFFKNCQSREECINEQEIALSTVILSKGWNINCLLPEYRGLDYRKTRCFNIKPREMVPYEVIFKKTNFGDPSNQISSLTDLNWHEELPSVSAKYLCQKITYGITEKKSIDVTEIIRKLNYINSDQLQPNTMFGDPFPERAKMLFIYVDKRVQPIILRELENKIIHHDYLYIFDHRGESLICHQSSVHKN